MAPQQRARTWVPLSLGIPPTVTPVPQGWRRAFSHHLLLFHPFICRGVQAPGKSCLLFALSCSLALFPISPSSRIPSFITLFLEVLPPITLTAQLVKNLLQCRRPQLDSWVRKIPWRRGRLPTPVFLGFPGRSAGKESACNVGDLGWIPGLGRSPGEGKGYPLHYSSLENTMDCSPWGCKESNMTERLSLTRIPSFVTLFLKVLPPATPTTKPPFILCPTLAHHHLFPH